MDLNDDTISGVVVNVPTDIPLTGRQNMPTRAGNAKDDARMIRFVKKKKAGYYSLMMAIVGIVLMILENELTGAHIYDKASIYSIAVKLMISVSTIMLLGLIIAYHIFSVQLVMSTQRVLNWKLAVTWQRVVQLCTEIAICAIHPLPGQRYFIWTTAVAHGRGFMKSERVSVDVIWSLPMFLRLYLILRVMMLHSQHVILRSGIAGNFSKVEMNWKVLLKIQMNKFPGKGMVTLIISWWIVASWMLRQCERYHDMDSASFMNSLRSVAMATIGIGYQYIGNTYCSQGISIVSGLLGVISIVLLVIIAYQSLKLNETENTLSRKMMEMEINERAKVAAANVVRETWLTYKRTKLVNTVDQSISIAHQRKLHSAIQKFKEVKAERAKLKRIVFSQDLAKMQQRCDSSDLHEKLAMIEARTNSIQGQLETLNESFMKTREI